MLANVSVDLDPIRCYGAIHALGDDAPSMSPPPAEDPVYTNALPRFRALFDALGIRATFFVVARDLEDASFAAAVRALAEDGHEIASHSLDHRYDLTRLGRAQMMEQLEDAARAIAVVVGQRPAGFRAPGYTVTDTLLEVLATTGVQYDASVFPCPSYWAAKAAVLASMRLSGRPGASILDSPAVLGAPAEPYRIGQPYTTRGEGLLEIPIGVTKLGRLPFIGTAVVLAGALGARALAMGMRGRAFANLELHGIDLCDRAEDGLDALGVRQRDLRVPLDRKRTALQAALAQLSADGRRFVRLDEVRA